MHACTTQFIVYTYTHFGCGGEERVFADNPIAKLGQSTILQSSKATALAFGPDKAGMKG